MGPVGGGALGGGREGGGEGETRDRLEWGHIRILKPRQTKQSTDRLYKAFYTKLPKNYTKPQKDYKKVRILDKDQSYYTSVATHFN